jgi:uridine phosphorylase
VPADPQQPVHLRPVAALAPRALLPGDPARALALAQVVLGDDRKMFNHHRGLWGYTGTAADGAPLTVQSTGIGGPSAAVVLEELAALGVRIAVRAGTCVALGADVALGTLIAVDAVRGTDGVSRALGAPERQALDLALTERLAAQGARRGTVVSADVYYAEAPATPDALARDLQTAALAAVAARCRVRFAAVLAVVADARGGRLDDEAVSQAGEEVGRAGAAAMCG